MDHDPGERFRAIRQTVALYLQLRYNRNDQILWVRLLVGTCTILAFEAPQES